MADPNKINIKITAEGGAEAAAQIKVAEDAAKAAAAAAEERAKKQAEWDAAAAVRREAMEKKAATTGFGGMLDGSPERMEEVIEKTEEATEAIEEQADAVEDLGEAADDAGKKSRGLDENVERIARAQKAQAIAELARMVGQIGQRFRDAADEVEDFDADAAAALRNTADRMEDVSKGVSAIALGFAAGGPLGAAAASLAVFLGSVADAYQETEVAALKAAAAQRQAIVEVADAARDAAAEAADRNEGLASAEVEAAIRRQTAALDAQTAALKEQVGLARERRSLENELLDSKDQLKLAEIATAEAAGKITKEEAARRRDGIESGARSRDRNERKTRAFEDSAVAGEDALNRSVASQQAAAAAAEAAAAEAAARAAANQATNQATRATSGDDSFFTENETYQNAYRAYEKTRQGGTDAEIEKGQKALEALKMELIKQAVAEAALALEALKGAAERADATQGAASTAATEAAAARRTAATAASRAGAVARTVDALEANDNSTVREQARRREVEAANQQQRKEDAEARRQQQAAEREAARQEREGNQQDRAGAAAGRKALSLLPDNVKEGFRAAVEKAAVALQDGDQGGEIEELTRLMGQLTVAVGSGNKSIAVELAALKRELAVLQSQSKLGRTGK